MARPRLPRDPVTGEIIRPESTKAKPAVRKVAAKKVAKVRKAPKTKPDAPGVKYAKLPPDRPVQEAPLTAAQERALIVNWMQVYSETQRRAQSASSEHKNVCKKIKAELGTYGIDKVKFALQTPEGALGELELIKVKLDVDHMFGGDFAERLKLVGKMNPTERAFLEGQAAALAGSVAKPPYDPGPAHDSWLNGYHKQQASVIHGGILAPETSHDQATGLAETQRAAQQAGLGSELPRTTAEPGNAVHEARESESGALDGLGAWPTHQGDEREEAPGIRRLELVG